MVQHKSVLKLWDAVREHCSFDWWNFSQSGICLLSLQRPLLPVYFCGVGTSCRTQYYSYITARLTVFILLWSNLSGWVWNNEWWYNHLGAGHLSFQKSIGVWPEQTPAQRIQCGVTGHWVNWPLTLQILSKLKDCAFVPNHIGMVSERITVHRTEEHTEVCEWITVRKQLRPFTDTKLGG